jgi:GTP-binding protein
MNSPTNELSLNPRVAIIGRPNVGKSTLFNILTDSRKSVVKNQPGVTRDLILQPAHVWGKDFDLIDTGGLTESKDLISTLIRESVLGFLSTVDFFMVVMDGRDGVIPEDREIMKLVKKQSKPFLIVVNKVDSVIHEETAKNEFYEFSDQVVAASLEQRRGISDVLEWLHQVLPEQKQELPDGLRLSIVGKPNAGKSSLVNALLQEDRMLVSNIAGTTVDSVDSVLIYHNQKYTLVDTAGLRKKANRQEDLEIIASFKTAEAIRRSHLVLLVVDGTLGPTEQDAKILEKILEEHKTVILVLNKVDLAVKQASDYRDQLREKISQVFHFYQDIPFVFVSSLTGKGIEKLFDEIEDIQEKLKFRVSTNQLNDFFFSTIRQAPAPVFGVSNVKFYYLTQTQQTPPSFIAFANHPEGVDNSYRRFLIKKIKEEYQLQGIPIRIFVMKSGEKRVQ